MHINPEHTYQLVMSKHRDYLREAEEYRLIKDSKIGQQGMTLGVKLGLILTGIISLFSINQFFTG